VLADRTPAKGRPCQCDPTQANSWAAARIAEEDHPVPDLAVEDLPADLDDVGKGEDVIRRGLMAVVSEGPSVVVEVVLIRTPSGELVLD
jgi:hypothetical protein